MVGEKNVKCVLADGCLRFYLRGRPISLYAPTAMMSEYQPTSVTVPPSQKLALEWVYPFTCRHLPVHVISIVNAEGYGGAIRHCP